MNVDCDVLIVGAGPVGLTLAAALGTRGVRVVVTERRVPGDPISVKANHVSARTMEIFRRLGVAGAVRAVGLPDDYPNDVAFRTTTTGIEFARTHIPSRAGRLAGETDGPDTGWPTPEPAHRVNQAYLEPVLFAHAEALDTVQILLGVEIHAVRQDDDSAGAVGHDRVADEEVRVACRYLVGCDGGSSMVRKTIGATLSGSPEVSRWVSTYIRAPQLLDMLNDPPAWMTLSVNPRQAGTVIAVDGIEKWLIHSRVPEGQDYDDVDRDRVVREILGVDDAFAYELLGTENWVGRRLVASRMADRRIFICGDAAHLWVPFSGYGMNAGIADAENLAWMLVATLHGWGGPKLLEAYEAERAPITEQVSHHAMGLSIESGRLDADVPPALEAAGPEGDRLRAEYGRRARDLSLRRHTAGGLNFGYFYDASPVIAYDGATAPDYDAHNFTQSTVPGCRTPHVWLAEGYSLYDALGEGFCVIRTDPTIDVDVLVSAAAARRVPLRVVDVDPAEASPYDHALVLSRPDGHVAWRGASVPQDPVELIDLVRGTIGVRDPEVV